MSFTPSAVWQQMAALEQEAGTQLFERGPRGARLTQPGQVLLAHAEVALDRLYRAEAEMAAVTRGEEDVPVAVELRGGGPVIS